MAIDALAGRPIAAAAALSVAVLDDEPLARRRLERLLAREPDVVLVGSFEHPLDARVALAPGGAVGEVDLLLLDIEMPGGSGFEMLEGWSGRRPHVIVVTAHAGHALPAFAHAAVDFLLKPYDDAAFARAIDRVRCRLRAEAALASVTSAAPTAVQLAASGAGPSGDQRADAAWPSPLAIGVPSEDGQGTSFIAPAAVVWVKSAGRDVVVLADGRQHRVAGRLKDFEARLAPFGFVRVHRGTIVNSAAMRGWRPSGHGDAELLLVGGERVSVSRRYAAALRARVL